MKPAAIVILFIGLLWVTSSCATEAPVPDDGTNPESLTTYTDEELLAQEEERDRQNQKRYEALRDNIRAGDLSGSLSMIDAIIEEDDLEAKWRSRFQVLKIRAKRDLGKTNLLRGLIRLERYRFEIGDIIKGVVVLENISGKDIVIPAKSEVAESQEGGVLETGTFFHRQVAYTEFLPSNTFFSETDIANIRVDEDIRLAPGESFRIPIELDTGRRSPTGTMLRSYVFDCTLHPSEIQVGDELYNLSLEFRSAEARIYPLNSEHLATHSLERVKEAFRKSAPVHLHLAASLVDGRQHDELYRFLQSKLMDSTTHIAMELAIMTSLRICSGNPTPENKEGWLTWLRNRGL